MPSCTIKTIKTQHSCEDPHSCSSILRLCFPSSSRENTRSRNAENLAAIFCHLSLLNLHRRVKEALCELNLAAPEPSLCSHTDHWHSEQKLRWCTCWVAAVKWIHSEDILLLGSSQPSPAQPSVLHTQRCAAFALAGRSKTNESGPECEGDAAAATSRSPPPTRQLSSWTDHPWFAQPCRESWTKFIRLREQLFFIRRS